MAEPIVEIKQGKLQGKILVDYKGGDFFSFQGIPYGKPPVGDLRFKAPLPAESWPGIRDATVEGDESVSKHMIFFHKIGTEDCLSLNVFTRQLPDGKSEPKPVMVWIHGGGFTAGSSKTEIYGPEFLITQDIVLVSINYRLGILGFMSLEDTSLGVPGNAGLKDQVLALKWVQNNIAKFNGDPNNVTIFGESAGSASVHYLILSPTTKGLFHRAIMQSGCSLNPWAFGSRNTTEIAKVLGHETKDEKDALEFLRSIPAEKFIDAQDLVKDSLLVDKVRPFSPVIEKPNPDAFLTEHPLDLMLAGKYNHVPIMIGFTNREGMFLEIFSKQTTGSVQYRLDNFERAIPYYYKIPKGSALSKDIGKKIEQFYYGASKTPEDDKNCYYIMYTDTFFLRGIYITTKTLLKNLNAPIYFYKFSVESDLNLYKKLGNVQGPGVSHADDLGYLFKSIVTPEFEPNSLEGKSLHRMIKLWTTFAKQGDPNPKEKDPLIDVVWPPVTPDEIKCLDIGEKLTIESNPEKERMDFWDIISATNGVNSKF